jgi:hypothetical protein
MKKIKYIITVALLGILIMYGCKNDDNLTTLPTPSTLQAPSDSVNIMLNIDSTGTVIFKWSKLPGSQSNVKYYILFDKAGTMFTNPVDSILADNSGIATQATITDQILDSIAGVVGIGQKKSGKIYWAIDAITSTKVITTVASFISVQRPTGLGTVPDSLYLTGDATEGGADITNAIPFKKVSNGLFESVTSLKSGTYRIVSGKTSDAKQYYFSDSVLYRGDTPMEYNGDTSPVLIRIDFNSTVGLQKIISSAQIVCVANMVTIATLQYQGNHVFTATNALFNFLVPGGPGAPSWLGWVEQRYKFMLQTDNGEEWFGSPYDDNMDASSDPINDPIYNPDPNGGQPAGYFRVYNVDPNDYWGGCYKFSDSFNGHPFNLKLDFNPSKYVHSITAP